MIHLLAQEFSKDYHGQTTMHPVGLVAVLILGIAMLSVPRRYALWPMVVMASLMSPAQRMVVLGLDFNLLRIMVLFGWARVLTRSETRRFRWCRLDTVLVMWAAVNTTVYTLQYATPSAFINRLGFSFDVIGMYFLFRLLVRSLEDVRGAMACFAFVAVPVAAAFLIEYGTGRNLFSFLGRVPEFTIVRDGRLRCQGAFAHPILAGCFWAALVPVLGALWWSGGRWRALSVCGVALSLLIIVLCSSSTPVMGVLAGVAAMAMYRLRSRTRLLRWSAAAMLVALHMVMQAPVWHLISRVSAVGGSTGRHRYLLIDAFVGRWGEWVLLGTKSTAHWGLGLQDVTNEFILQAVRGGLASLILFVASIAIAFSRIGRQCGETGNAVDRLLIWGLGTSLFVHCVNFIGVSYTGQISMLWYLTLAVIGSLTSVSRSARAPTGVPAPSASRHFTSQKRKAAKAVSASST